MSWIISDIAVKPVAEAKELLASNSAPQSIKDYCIQGIDGLVAAHGEDVIVSISGQGHVCTGPGSYEVTSAKIEIKPVNMEA